MIRKVESYRQKLTQWNIEVEDSTKLFDYSCSVTFAKELAKYVRRNPKYSSF